MTDIFRAYDIRGIYPSDVNEALAYKLGRAFVTFLKVKSVVVGRDGRLSSRALCRELIRGITDQGADVIDIGLCSTPLFYFCSRDAPASIMVTASHNPRDYNGFKLCREKAYPLSEDNGMQKIQTLVEKNIFSRRPKGKVMTKNYLRDFITHNLRFIDKNLQPLKIVLDAGNGMSGYTFPLLFAALRQKNKWIELVELYTKLDFTFPHHESNPLNFSTLKDLHQKIISERADFGIATDSDGDRCIFLDEKGMIIPADIMTAFLAIKILQDYPHSKILYDVRCSRIVHETIEKNGGIPVLSRVGHSFIKKKMHDEGIVFGGELSGHLYYQKNNYTESPFISTALIMNILSESEKRLSELIQPLRTYFSSGEINLRVQDKKKLMADVERKYGKKAQQMLHLDGLSIYYQKWWFNLRPSGTEDFLRLNLEADSKELMEKKKREVLKLLRS